MVDLLVLGATGYTGKLITRYLAVHRERDSFKFGIAGRSKSKLDQLASELGISGIQSYTVDVSDDASIKALLDDSKAKVFLTTVGPYTRWGKPIAHACAQNGVHYVDITGETPFVRDLIVELDFLATKTNAILIPSAGFDSLPSDAIAYLSACTLRSSLKSLSGDGHGLENVGVVESHSILHARSGISGGTIASIVNMIDTVPRKRLMQGLLPDALSPIKLQAPSGSKLVFSLPATHPKRYGHFSFLVPHNIAIVQRTRGLFQLNANAIKANAANDEDVIIPAYAENYTYGESWAASNRVTAFLISLGFVLGAAFFSVFPPLRWFAKRLLPAGQGPSDKALEEGWLKMENISVSTPIPDTGKPLVVESYLRGRGDPAYALTAVMASEVALALLTPREKLPLLARQGGVLTPMAALGPLILKRLSASERFEFESNLREDSS